MQTSCTEICNSNFRNWVKIHSNIFFFFSFFQRKSDNSSPVGIFIWFLIMKSLLVDQILILLTSTVSVTPESLKSRALSQFHIPRPFFNRSFFSSTCLVPMKLSPERVWRGPLSPVEVGGGGGWKGKVWRRDTFTTKMTSFRNLRLTTVWA